MEITRCGKSYKLVSQDGESEVQKCTKCAFEGDNPHCDNTEPEVKCNGQDVKSGFELEHYWVEKE